MTVYLVRGDQVRGRVADLRKRLVEAEGSNATPPPPLDAAQLVGHLADIRGLLDGSMEKSAALLLALTGKIKVREQTQPGESRKAWTGEIRGDLVPFLAAAAREKDYPWLATLEFLILQSRFAISGRFSLITIPRGDSETAIEMKARL